jgi:alkyldihydroxyacetonephosphate synthase
MADKKVTAKGSQSSSPVSGGKIEVQRAFPPLSRQDVLKWNAWGYKDSGFRINDKGQGEFTGNRYALAGKELPQLVPFMDERGFDRDLQSFSQPPPKDEELPKPVINQNFESEISKFCVKLSHSGIDRIVHSHGHTCHELFSLRTGKWGRIPDVVVWPRDHKDVEVIVRAANRYNVCVIPFGGGTNVSGALICPPEEKRSIVSLDMTTMDRILWIDEKNLTAHVEAGIIGQDMERQLREKGYTCGHEPDSIEFSSVGGWVATRSSGMKKNVYGNIEDLVVNITMVTPRGVLQRNFNGPRNSLGPDIQHVIMGSEGILGVVTEVTLKIRPVPPTQRYGSVLFKDFECGIQFMREVARQRCAPASIRLMDNEQFMMGQSVKEHPSGVTGFFSQWFKKMYLTKFKGFDLTQCAACTLLFEGTANEVAIQEKRIYSIASQFGGIQGGSDNGQYGYMMTYCVAYMRDLGFDYCFVAESFETSVPWDRYAHL